MQVAFVPNITYAAHIRMSCAFNGLHRYPCDGGIRINLQDGFIAVSYTHLYREHKRQSITASVNSYKMFLFYCMNKLSIGNTKDSQ